MPQFVVSLEIRRSEISDRADVVFPVAPVVEKSGTFIDWEGRERPFPTALPDTGALSDLRILDALAETMGLRLGLPDIAAARAELVALGQRRSTILEHPAAPPGETPKPVLGEAVLSTWRMLLDAGRMQDGEPHLAGTARAPVARCPP